MSGALERLIANFRSLLSTPEGKEDDSVNFFYRIPNLEEFKEEEESDELTLAESAGFAVRRLVEA